MKKQLSLSRQWLMAGAILFLAAACQPKESDHHQSKPSSTEMGGCKPAPQDCPKKECPCPADCKKECPKECPCPKKECPCPAKCPEKECCEVEMNKETKVSAAQKETRSEVKSEQALSTAKTAVEVPAS